MFWEMKRNNVTELPKNLATSIFCDHLLGKKNEPIRKDEKWKEIWGHSGSFSYLQSPKTRLSSLVSTLYLCHHPTIASFLDCLQLLPCQFPFLNFQLWWEKKISTPVTEVTSAPSHHTSSWVLSKVFTLPS